MAGAKKHGPCSAAFLHTQNTLRTYNKLAERGGIFDGNGAKANVYRRWSLLIEPACKFQVIMCFLQLYVNARKKEEQSHGGRKECLKKGSGDECTHLFKIDIRH